MDTMNMEQLRAVLEDRRLQAAVAYYERQKATSNRYYHAHKAEYAEKAKAKYKLKNPNPNPRGRPPKNLNSAISNNAKNESSSDSST